MTDRSSRNNGPTPVGPTLAGVTAGPRFLRPVRPEPVAEPKGPPVCPRCAGRGYELYPSGELARARLCGCNGPCPECKGQGYRLETRDDGYTYHVACDCRGVRRRLERFNQTLIPSHYAFKDLGNFQRHEGTEHVCEFVQTYARGFPADTSGILLVGQPGVGKTHLVVGVLKILTLEKGVRCLFKDFFLLLSEVKEAYETGRFDTEVLRPLTEVEVLVIDELGKGRTNSDWEQGLLDEIICKRYNQMKTTLLTTNFPLESSKERQEELRKHQTGASAQKEGQGNLSSSRLIPSLEERVGERIFSRLRQMCTVLRVEAADYRRTHSAGGSRSRP